MGWSINCSECGSLRLDCTCKKCEHGVLIEHYCLQCEAKKRPVCAHGNQFYCGSCGGSVTVQGQKTVTKK